MPNIVQINLTVGIPSEAVYFSVFGNGGTFNGGVKCNPSVKVDLDIAGNGSLKVSPLIWGITEKYNDDDSIEVDGKPDWFRKLKPGSISTDKKRLERDATNLDVSFIELDGATHAVKFYVNGANPLLLPGSPDIDAEIVVGLRKKQGGIEYFVKGTHDGFPKYSLEILNKKIYEWDPVKEDKSPSDLSDVLGEKININWTML